MRSRNASIVVLALGLMLLTVSAALAGDTGVTAETDDSQTWSQTFLSSDLTGLDVRTIDSVAIALDELTVAIADKAKNVTTVDDTWDVNLAISDLTEDCTPGTDCVNPTALVLAKDHADVAPAATVSTGDVPLVGAAVNSADVTAGAGGTLDQTRNLFSGSGYATGTAIGLYTQVSTLSYDWDSAMAAATTLPGDYVGATFDSTVTVTLVE